jgi:hypothetical protein
VTWTSNTVVLKLYEAVDTTHRFDGQRFDQWLDALRRRPIEEVGRALIGVFENTARTRTRYLDQQYAGSLLLALRPPCFSDVGVLIRRLLPTWDLSVEQLPWYFDAVLGRETLLQALATLAGQALSEEEQKALETFHFWLRARHPDNTPILGE